MKYTRFTLVLIFLALVGSCSKPASDLNPTEDPITVKATDVNLASLDQDAVEFYKDIAVMAEWYADHPAVLKAELAKNSAEKYTDSLYNDFVAELASMELYDEKDKPVSFFDLDETTRHTFLKDYVKLEASFLDSKFKIAANEQADDHIELVNAAVDKTVKTSAFSDNFDFNAEAARIKSSNPYETVSADIQNTLGAGPPPKLGLESQSTTEQTFLKFLADSRILGYSVVTFNPLCFNNTPQKFVDKMRSGLRKGRVLVSLPGGFMTGSPLALNAGGGSILDVGHVAIVSKDASEIPATVNADYVLSIGTNNEENMHNEKLGKDWTSKHGVTYLMQPIKVTYRYKFPVSWERSQTDLDNSKTYQKITSVMDRKYCYAPEMLYAKWKAPDRFICSSSAWWAIKEAHGVGIGDFYKSTIFPAGVYESSDMRIVGMSF
ncbi:MULTISPECIES: hypothetical protein [unclassified Spirosoma]|uniref:hypothetical protein n=1 Tax=unclassified Spirosoma TaxID=2621999 RepID=UPI00096668F9|nr:MULTISPECIES: hypothetical protein [unclassified Spirosoma]MBN8821570.1 hypothetical protein [Spirosoma sp.]OJW78344.1 MAG: hypothetical protein BGO59_30520 [Spirosoma sp. 48-14]